MSTSVVAYPDEVTPREPELMPVQKAAEKLGIGEATIWRYLRYGLLARYKPPKGAPRQTQVDMRELRKLRKLPPAERVDPPSSV